MKNNNQLTLLRERRFGALFATQFLGAFNDNVYKNAVVMLITYVLAIQSNLEPQIMVTLAAGIFILPFFLFSATAGQMADKFDRGRMIGYVKFAEIIIMSIAAVAFMLHSLWGLMAVLFLMGTQSAFFGPLKYGILPNLLKETELVGGNALISAATFLAILFGTIAGGLLVVSDGALRTGGDAVVSVVLMTLAVLGWIASRFIPSTAAAEPDLKIRYNLFTETTRILRHASESRAIFLTILGISWFWLIGATFLAQFPTLGRVVLGANEQVVILFLTVFSIGVGFGSMLCNRLLNGQVHATFVPLGALGMTVFTVDLYFATRGFAVTTSDGLLSLKGFLQDFSGWRVVIDLGLIAACGGLYIVPLNALLQKLSSDQHRARNVASANVMNALFMVVSAIATLVMLKLGLTVPQVFLVIAVINAGVAVYICRLLPGALVRATALWLLDLLFRVEVRGLEHYEKAGKRVVIVANHQSFLDALLIAAVVPDALTFAVNTHIARMPLVRFFLSFSDTFPLDPGNPLAMRSLVERLRGDGRVVIFPEGRITVTGSLMKVYEGPGMIADRSDATLLPVRIEGAQYSKFSRLGGKVRTRWLPKISVQFMPPVSLDVPEGLSSRERRRVAGERLYDVMSDMIFHSSDYRQTLFQSLLDARAIHGGNKEVAEDIERNPLNYNSLITGSVVLGRKLAQRTQTGETVGLMLPNAAATVASFFGMQAYHRVPAMLNFSAGTHNVMQAIRAARIRSVVTSRRFVGMTNLDELISAMTDEAVEIIYLEDLRQSINVFDKLVGWMLGKTTGFWYPRSAKKISVDDPAVVLFTSGSEGSPKGVVLSHVNVQANRSQVSARIDFGPSDIVFNALPMFHSFGLTCGTLLPIFSGLRVFLYPSPLHYRIVPELVYETNATIMFGTDTFLSGYARFAHPYDFYSMRYVFAGAEKLKEETSKLFADRFGVRIFEGYGATETSPVLSLNSPMHHQAGSVGRLLPGMTYQLETVPGIEQGGKLIVQGPNVMLGYLRGENPGELERPDSNGYDTGDIVEIDNNGFIFLRGRVKRFAKIAGEMVSLSAVEDMANTIWPDSSHAVVNIPDAKKGEALVLMTTQQDASKERLSAYAREHGITELSVPKRLIWVDELPLLGTGKVDYPTVLKTVLENIKSVG